MKNEFEYVLKNYPDAKNNAKDEVWNTLIRQLPSQIRNILGRDDIEVQGSMGIGGKTYYPWISMLNKKITRTTQKGIYVVYLFKRDMSGFYIALDQGMTNFDKIGRRKYDVVKKTVDYFKKEIDSGHFSKGEVDLGSKSKDTGYGYEKTAIISKYYERTNYTEDELVSDLKCMISEYDKIVEHMSSGSYDELIQNIIDYESDGKIQVDDALDQMKEALDSSSNAPVRNIEMVEKIPYVDMSDQFSRITRPLVRKTDYIKKAARDAAIGLKGEELALEYEKKRLIELGREDLAKRVHWISRINDGAGYDIDSFELDGSGVETPIMIEVKTTTTIRDTRFFVSVNEKTTADRLKKQYYIFRIYDADSLQPKFYRVSGRIEDNFHLDPATFSALFKGLSSVNVV